jgi:hypothetical protein
MKGTTPPSQKEASQKRNILDILGMKAGSDGLNGK